jgi:ubiquinone/menaquinone biosynthesis C-methylase UbiE
MLDQIPTHRSLSAYQAFVLDCKLHWTRRLYPALRERYEAKARASGSAPRTRADAQALLDDELDAQFFGWFERHFQRMKYSGPEGLAEYYGRHRESIREALSVDLPEGLLQLQPDFQQPDYYTAVDIHQHPGGVWSDEIAGFVYERGAQSTAPMLKNALSLWQRFKAQILSRTAAPVSRVVDLGCGFGASTRPWYLEHPEMELTGVELSAPCLRVAAVRAAQAGVDPRRVQFRQADAIATGLPAGTSDVVTSTMLVHEMPPSHIRGLLKEAHRLLRPGGLSIHLDFLMRGDPFGEYIHYGHSQRNNEPFMVPLNEMDLEAAHRDAGLVDLEILPFEEFDGALSMSGSAWRFPWTMIIARKPG